MFFTLLMLTSCDEFARHEYFVKLHNNSCQNIYCYAAFVLPDTILSFEKPKLIEVNSMGTGYVYGYDFSDPSFQRLKKEKLTIFIFNKDTVVKNTWDYIRVNYKILKRIEVNEKDIINMGGSVYYP